MSFQLYPSFKKTLKEIFSGKHRRASKAAHSDPSVGAGSGSGGTITQGVITITFTGGGTVSWDSIFEPVAEPAPPAIPYAGIRTGELIGHRLWWVVREGDEIVLTSHAHRRIWIPGEVVEGDVEKIVLTRSFGFPPIFGGIYAFAERADANNAILSDLQYISEIKPGTGGLYIFAGGWDPYSEQIGLVYGTVKMWGEVIEHEKGYRAQYAKIDTIDEVYATNDVELLATVRKKYLPNHKADTDVT